MKRAIDIRAQSQVQRQVSRGFPIVLRKKAENIRTILVVIYAAPAEAEGASSLEEVLPVGQAIGRIHEKYLAIKCLRKQLVQVYSCELRAESEIVGAFHPAHVVHKIEVILYLRLVCRGSWPNLESRGSKRKFVDRFFLVF